jgi:RNA polymerase sigma factor (sigma-70 family)
LIGAVLAGDRDSYAKLVDRYAGYTHALAYGYLQDTQAAEDIAQEAFVKAFTALRTLAAPKVFGAWLAQITRNLCRATLRRKQPPTASLSAAESLPHPASTEAEARAADRHVREVLNEALDKLPPKLREAVSLFYLQGQSLLEIAGFLGVSENTVKQRLHRARACLREHLDETLKEELPRLRPSGRFTNAVMAVLPLRPFDVGWAAAGLGKLVSWVLLTPWLSPIIIVLLTNKVTNLLMLSDVNARYRAEFKKSMRSFGYTALATAVLGVVAGMLMLDRPWLSVVFFLVPGLLLLFLMHQSLTLMPLTWRTLIGPFSFAAMLALFCLYLCYPYRADFQLGYEVAFLVLLCVFLFISGSALRPKKYKVDETPVREPQPVSMDFLRHHAIPFARVLNAQGPWVSGVHIEQDCIRYVTGIPRMLYWFLTVMMFRRPPWIGCEFRLFPDGHVEVDLPDEQWRPGTLIPHRPPEAYKSGMGEWFRRRWAFYQTGDLKQAQPATLQFELYPHDFFKTRKGFRWFRYFNVASVVVLAVLIGWIFYGQYITTPTLTTARLRGFYQGEFLDLYRKGFPEKPSQEPNHVSDSRMALVYRQPPSMMSIPGLAEAYIDLQKKAFDEYPTLSVLRQAPELVRGLEGGYLTIPMLESWGVTREALTPKDGERPEWATLDPKTLSGQAKLGKSELSQVIARARLLHAMGLMDLMDPRLPDEIVKRLKYSDGAFCPPDESWNELETTCLTACLLSLFDRWDLADRKATGRWVTGYPRRHRYYCNADGIYHLGLGIVAVGAENELPLRKLATFKRPVIMFGSRESSWSIAPYDIDEFAVNDILSSGALLELRYGRKQDRAP